MFLMINFTSIFMVIFLIIMECLLSMDNALVLALMVRHLPAKQQKRALTYGIWGAFVFRFISLFALTWMMESNYIKILGAGYLFYMGIGGLITKPEDGHGAVKNHNAFGFWRTVLMVELMDIAFSVDSILAAVSLSQNYFIVFIGGVLGILSMRFVANIFIHLLDKYPRLEKTAYLMILAIAMKLAVQALGEDIAWLDFHSSKSPAAWLFWMSMSGALYYGLTPKRKPVPVF